MKPFRLLLALGLLFALASTSPAGIQTIPTGNDASSMTLVEQRDDALVYQLSVGDLEAMEVSTPEGSYTRLLLPGFHRSFVEGSPELPMMNRLIEIPYGATARVEVTIERSREIDLASLGLSHPLFPAQPPMAKSADPASVPFVVDRAAYAEARVARPLGVVEEQGTLRAVRIGRLEISPVEYYPLEHRLVVHDQMTVRVSFTGGDPVAEGMLRANTYSPFFEGLYEQIDGYRGQHDLHPDLVRDVVTLAIVVPPQYEAQMQGFVDWKRTRGFHVVVGVTGTPEVGTTNTSIKAWLTNLYNNGTPTQPAPSFVLFVGDVDVMPTWLQSSDCTDRPYCAVDADLIPEMYYGRFSCSNPTNLQAMIDKSLMYDQFTMPDPSYLGNVVMIAGYDTSYGQLYANGQINYGTSTYFNTAHGIYSYTHLYPGSGSQDAQIVQEVSNGVAYVNYTAHGSQTSWSDPTFTQANINGLQNAGEYCMAVGNCCLTSDYDYGSECFAETWLRAANKGAIGYIGGSNSTYWDEDYWWGVGYRSQIVQNPTYDAAHLGAYDGMFHDHGEAMSKWYVTNDAYVFCGNLAVTESGSGLTTYYWNIYNLMGDPTLSTYLGVPAVNPVTHPAAILVGWTSIQVTAAPNSYVGLTMGGTLLGAGTTDAGGNLTLPIWNQLLPGTAHLCVTAQNRRPYRVDIPVTAPSGPYVVHESTTVLDGVTGDGDGVCDAGETVDLSVQLKNVGVEAATDVTAALTTNDTYATITTASQAYPDIPAGGTVTSLGNYRVELSDATPDNHPVEFNLTVQSAQGSWNDSFALTVGCPVLACTRTAVNDDPPLGNGSGWLIPGESAGVIVTMGNTGHGNASNAVLTLTGGSLFVEIVEATGTCAEIPAQGEGSFSPVVVRIAPGCPVPSVQTVEATVQADFGYTAVLNFQLTVGGFADDVEAARGWTIGVAGDNATSGLWTRVDPNGTTYNGSVVQPEDDHTSPPGVTCFVTGNGSPGGAAGEQDLDGGTTTLVTPTFDLSRVDGATVRYWVWYTNNLGNNPNQDYWDVEVTGDGVTWVDLEHTTASTNAWVERTFDLESYITLTDQVRIRFVASDTGSNSLVEALIDDFVLTVEEVMDPESVEPALAPTTWMLSRVHPNPAAGRADVRFEAPSRSRVAVRVFDVSGALIRTLHDGVVEPGRHTLTWDRRNDTGLPVAAGVYYARLEAPGFVRSKPIVLVH